MIEICRLTKRQVDPSSKKLPTELEQVKVFSMTVGHGIGTVDFVECVGKIEEDEYDKILQSSGKYAQFKLGNLSKYFEIEVFPEHASKLYDEMPDCSLKEQFLSLKEGYIVIRKAI
jgi:hypothetical protein